MVDRKAPNPDAGMSTAHDTFRYLVEHSPFGIYAVDGDFRLVQVSAGAQKVFEQVRPLLQRDFAEVLRIIWPEPFASEAIARFRHTLATGEPYHSPRTVERRRDIGETESYDWKIERLTLPDGRLGVVCHFYDLSERQRHEEHVQLLMQEINHRSKNLLAVIQAIANQTAQISNPREFARDFSQRLRGIAAAQDLLTEGNWTAVDFAELVRSQLNYLSSIVDKRITIEGPNVLIGPSAAQAIGLALHELSTNALKYGALSNDRGSVTIAWSWIEEPPDRRARISWTEQGGPPVREPKRRGFGRTVLEEMSALSLNAEVELQFDPSGLIWSVSVPEQMIVRKS
jgi:two-component sensor histidine kinase